jgi:transposase InsO family protein
MLEILERLKQKLGVSYRDMCRELNLPYSNVMRWKYHIRRGEPAIGKPGIAKVAPPDYAKLYHDVAQLDFKPKRTPGTTALYKLYEHLISRRDFQNLVEVACREAMQAKEALERRVNWLKAALVWSMDDTETGCLTTGSGHIHLVQDLGSRYKLLALGDEVMVHGEQVAANLGELFNRHGAPLFFKRDNGSNLNHHAVDEVFGEFGVIPLNSPPYYPPYNGGIERAQLEMQYDLEGRFGIQQAETLTFNLRCQVSRHEINHKRRRSLGWQTSCQALETGRPLTQPFNRRKRKEIFEEIKRLAVDITEQLDEHTRAVADTAFRYAAETWMQLNNIIRVTRDGVVLPPFYQIRSH